MADAVKTPIYKRWWFWLISVVVMVGILGCSSDTGTNTEDQKSAPNIKFEQIGYYKAENKLRYFTFYVSGYGAVEGDSIPDDLKAAIEKHGSNRMHTPAQVTASFYYIELGQAPNITGLTAQAANDLAHARQPIMSVWIMPTGQVNVIERPG